MEIKLAENDEELMGILALQKENHLETVSKESNTDGFVTVKHTLDILKRMQEGAKQVIAVDQGKVVGYAIVMLKEFRDLVPVLMPMFDKFENVQYKGKKLSDHRYYVMGQVCVAKDYRGKGIFTGLYEKHRESYSDRFDICLTEVSTSNPRSIKAHAKVGFQTLHTFSDETDDWLIIGWDWRT